MLGQVELELVEPKLVEAEPRLEALEGGREPRLLEPVVEPVLVVEPGLEEAAPSFEEAGGVAIELKLLEAVLEEPVLVNDAAGEAVAEGVEYGAE